MPSPSSRPCTNSDVNPSTANAGKAPGSLGLTSGPSQGSGRIQTWCRPEDEGREEAGREAPGPRWAVRVAASLCVWGKQVCASCPTSTAALNSFLKGLPHDLAAKPDAARFALPLGLGRLYRLRQILPGSG